MTLEDVREVTKVAKDILKTNGDAYSEHILAYISELEKENVKLKAQIEKMKCCGNCRHWKNESIQKYCVLTAPDFLIKKRIDKCDKWESAKS